MIREIPRKIRTVCAITIAVLIPAFKADAVLLLNEPFDYPNGTLIAVSGGSWTTHSGTAGQVDVLNGRVDLRVPDTEDVNVLVPGQPFSGTTNTVLYVSFIVNFSTLPSSGGQYFAHFRGSAFRAKVVALTSGATAGQFRLGVLNNIGGTASVTNLANLSLNTDYRVYLRYVVNSGVTTMWVDPGAEDSLSVTAVDTTSAATSITSFALRQDSGLGVVSLDDLRIGTSFADVYVGPMIIAPTITQPPVSTSTIEGGAATFAVTAAGTAPLSYQWRFNGNPITDATNSTLTLLGVTTNFSGQYSVTVVNAGGVTNSSAAVLTVILPNASGTLSVVHYNVKGNFASDWSTNAPQVRAIARQLIHLDPDIITLNEIPNGLRHEMTNWMAAFFPSRQLAVSPGTDGVLRSAVISRFPIMHSQSWLEDANLVSFGHNGAFTRDLFEAEIAVPGTTERLHVFTTHLKSGSDVDSQQRRAAECSAISNHFATVFLPVNGQRQYILTGDLNEDIAIPMSQGLQAIQRLTNATGLKLTTPVNPFTLLDFTHSIQGSIDARFDYVMPKGLLLSNIVNSQVFRTDQLPPPLPLNLFSNDNLTASDHLPVVTVFNYPDPRLVMDLSVSNQVVTVRWPALIGRKFTVFSSSNLITWTVAGSNVTAQSSTVSWSKAIDAISEYFKIERVE
jgi:endonuclease/exonuclease/phosphatase family metal-dependent hydrolase